MQADAVQIKREMEAGRGEVRVMTVHGAKGLEAPIVFLPDTTQLPRDRSGGLFAHEEAGLLWSPDMKMPPPGMAHPPRWYAMRIEMPVQVAARAVDSKPTATPMMMLVPWPVVEAAAMRRTGSKA